MKFIADFHTHSHYSLATSKQLTPEYCAAWARIKGITLVGTGDFTHPRWVEELKEKLEPAEQGLWKLKKEFEIDVIGEKRALADQPVRFILTAEISSIYKKDKKVRKVHNLIFAPDFKTVEVIGHKLGDLGCTIDSDGRPIIGLSAHDLLDLALSASEDIFFVPAHIWTPWFSVLGDKSGFDSIEECFDDLSHHIYALETGLSSDPPMNWLCSRLDRFTLISNSDAHSPDRLGRNATVFKTDLSYASILGALKTGHPSHFGGTINLFPQEGKYHYDGHRTCSIVWNPLQTLKNRFICPVCAKKVTVGVMHRVASLADRDSILHKPVRPPFSSIIPLKEMVAEICETAPGSKACEAMYRETIMKLGPELPILLDLSPEYIATNADPLLAEAIRRMRNRQVIVREGFDGEYGTIRVFHEGEVKAFEPQQTVLFGDNDTHRFAGIREIISFDIDVFRNYRLSSASREETLPVDQDRIPDQEDVVSPGDAGIPSAEFVVESSGESPLLARVVARRKKSLSPPSSKDEPVVIDSPLFVGLNERQRCAVVHGTGPALVLAGPGAGKTRVLTARIAYLVAERGIDPASILAITFTQKASREISQRLGVLLEGIGSKATVPVSTFHAFGHQLLKHHYGAFGRQKEFTLIDEDDRCKLIGKEVGLEIADARRFATAIGQAKMGLLKAEQIQDPEVAKVFLEYERLLQVLNAFDLDDLVSRPVLMLEQEPTLLRQWQEKIRWILVDEYQDINLAQFRMMQMLVSEQQNNLFVIGDPNQAIYGFRGSNVAFITTFMNTFAHAVVYGLDTSYRCSDIILRAAHQVLDSGSVGWRMKGNADTAKISISAHQSDAAEAEFIARTIEKMIGGVSFFSLDSSLSQGDRAEGIASFADFVVLARTNRQLAIIAEALQHRSIPTQSVDEAPLFRTEPVKSVVGILKIMRKHQHPELIRYICQKVAMTKSFVEKSRSLLDSKTTVYDKLQTILMTFFHIQKLKDDPSILELLELSHQYPAVDDFLEFVDTGARIDLHKPAFEAVSLMSLHASKGLEFSTVFIAGCEDGLLPYTIFENRKADFDEEKRLLYVGMTRAKNYLFLTHAHKRSLYGKQYALKRSPYLSLIEQDLLQIEKQKSKARRVREEEKTIQLNLFE